MPTSPKNVHELVEQLVQLENENAALKKKLRAASSTNQNGRQKLVSVLTRATKKSSFTNHEVKQMVKEVLDIMEKPPLLR